MLRNVMEVGRFGLRKPASTNRMWIRGLAIALAVGVTWATPQVHAQEGAAPEFSARVLDLSKSYQRLDIPLNRSVTVETTIGVSRADVVAPSIANVQVISPTRMLVTGQSFGNTSVVLTGTDGKQYVFEAFVELDLEPLNRSIKSIDRLSTAEAQSVRGNIVLVGSVTSSDRARRIADLAQLFAPAVKGAESRVQNHLEISGEQQVLLRCIVAEVSRFASRELGVNGFLAGEHFRDGFLVNNLGGINPVNIGAGGSQLVTEDMGFFTDVDGLNLLPTTPLSLGFPNVQTQIFIQALADNNLLKIMAEPNLTAISGETATFLAGGEFPIPVPQGNQQVTIEFREFGVRLNFTPIVRGQQRVRLRVAPEVSELDFTTAVQVEGFIVPGLTTRATETTVELGSGQTIAIAGLLSEQVRGAASRIPGLGDIPVLGTLFRSVNFQRRMTELVVLVTPEIVAPLDPHQKVQVPGGDMEYANDYELYALGLLESRNTAPPDPRVDATQDDVALESEPDEISLHGPWGHAGTGSAR